MVQYQTAASGEAGPHDYGLAPLPPLPCPEMRGPTPWSNWVLRGRLLAGAYPASLDDAETERILTTLLELGVNTFVCLQAEFSLHTPEAAWRSGQGLRPYIKDAQKLLIRARETGSRRILQDKLDFLHLPIIDGSVTSDLALSRLADDCCTRILRGERLYVHCWGGHGRTGTLIAVMLGRLFGLTCAAALRYTQAFHDSRKFPQGVRSPQTTPQVAQVKRLLPDPPSVRGVVYPRDPSVVLDDVILRPGSAPPSPTLAPAAAPAISLVSPPAASKPAVAAVAPPQLAPQRPPSARAAPGGSAGPAGISQGPAKAGPPAAAEVADSMMDLDDSPALPTVPVNQQRKEAIRAAKQAGASVASAASSALSAALKAAGLQAGPGQAAGAPAAAGAIPAAPAPSERQRDWLQNAFGKSSLAREAQRQGGSSQGSIGTAAAPAATLQGRDQQSGRNAGYLDSYLQQQQQQDAGLAGIDAKAGASGRPTIHLTASSGAAAIVGGPYGEEASQQVDMRPSRVTVGVPVPVAAPERSPSSMARIGSYLTGLRAASPPSAHQ